MIQLFTEQLDSPGGPILIALILISIASGAVTIYKFLQFWRLGVGRYRKRAVGSDRPRELQRSFQGLARGGEAVHQADLEGTLCGDQLPAQRPLHRQVVRHSLGQTHQASAGRDEAALDLR